MSGITIIGVKVVGLCGECRKKSKDYDWPLYDKNGRKYEDQEISCIGCAL